MSGSVLEKMIKVDWPVIGAVAGTLVLAGATTAWLCLLYQSSADVRVAPAAPSAQTWAEPVEAGKIKESASQYVQYDSSATGPAYSDYARPVSPSVQART